MLKAPPTLPSPRTMPQTTTAPAVSMSPVTWQPSAMKVGAGPTMSRSRRLGVALMHNLSKFRAWMPAAPLEYPPPHDRWGRADETVAYLCDSDERCALGHCERLQS